MSLSFALMISIPVQPAVSAPPANPETILDRHHLVYGAVVPDPTDVPFGTPGELYACLSCHQVDADAGQILVERDCRACHQSDRHHIRYDTVIPYPTDAPFGASGELFGCFSCHETETSSGYTEFPVERDCQVCHRPSGESRPPVAVDDSYATMENTLLEVPAPGALGNDGVVLSATLVSDVRCGTLALLPSGAFSYVPDPDFVGDDRFTYVANNGLADSNVATVTIMVVEAEIQDIVVDILPCSDRNRFDLGSRGPLPVAVLGPAGLDVTEIDVSSLLLEGQVAPSWSDIKRGRHGAKELWLKFDSAAVGDVLGDLQLGQTYEVWITGTLKDGTPIAGSDFVLIVGLPHEKRGGDKESRGRGKRKEDKGHHR